MDQLPLVGCLILISNGFSLVWKIFTHPSKAQRSMFTTLCKVEIFRSLTFISLSLSTFVYLCLNWKFMIFERPPVPAQGWEFTNCIYNSNHTCFTIVIVIVILLFKIPTTHVSQLLLLLLFCYLKFQPHMFHNCYFPASTFLWCNFQHFIWFVFVFIGNDYNWLQLDHQHFMWWSNLLLSSCSKETTMLICTPWASWCMRRRVIVSFRRLCAFWFCSILARGDQGLRKPS